jgi:uncharacterized protein
MGAETKQSRTQRVTRVLCAAEPRGSADAIDALVHAASDLDVQAIALVGDLTSGDDHARADYRGVFRALGRAGLPAFWVPGPADAPVEHYLREAHNIEIVHPFLHGVHGSVAFASGSVLVAGFGGEVDDDPEGARDEQQRLRYPRWEAEYRLKALERELSEVPELILLFATPPAHKGLGIEGSEALAELAATYRARLVVCAGSPRTMMIGRTLVVAPGPLVDGACAVADLHARTVERVYARGDRAVGPRVRA